MNFKSSFPVNPYFGLDSVSFSNNETLQTGQQEHLNLKLKSKIETFPAKIMFSTLLGLNIQTDLDNTNADETTNKAMCCFPGVSNMELFHAVVGLYDVCLPDINLDDIYSFVHHPNAQTVVVTLDKKGAILQLRKDRKLRKVSSKSKRKLGAQNRLSKNAQAPLMEESEESEKFAVSSDETGSSSSSSLLTLSYESTPDFSMDSYVRRATDRLKLEKVTSWGVKDPDQFFPPSMSNADIEPVSNVEGQSDLGQTAVIKEEKHVPVRRPQSLFFAVYADDGSSDLSKSTSPDYTSGLEGFLSGSKERRRRREDGDGLTIHDIGIEDRVVGAVTFVKSSLNGEPVIHLQLLAVRKRFRKMGVASYLVSKVKDPKVSGEHSAVIVCGVNGRTFPVNFFKTLGFQLQTTYNYQFQEFLNKAMKNILMCYPVSEKEFLAAPKETKPKRLFIKCQRVSKSQRDVRKDEPSHTLKPKTKLSTDVKAYNNTTSGTGSKVIIRF